MEGKIKSHNLKHFTKAHSSKVYNNKIYAELTNPRVRDDILKGRLRRNECDNEKVQKFPSLLAVSEERRRGEITQKAEITEEE